MKYLYYILLAFYCVSCGQGNKQKNITDISISENKDNTVNVINQAKPKLMIIPSDRMLKDEKCLTINTFNGKKTIIRDIPNKRQPKKTSPTNKTGKTVSTMNYEYIVVLRKED